MDRLAAAPLDVMNVQEAMDAQFRLTEVIAQGLPSGASLEDGDLGVAEPDGVPRRTREVEAILSRFFGAEDCALVRGGGTGAIRAAMFACLEPGSAVLFHDAPIYHTTLVTTRAMGITPVYVDLNALDASTELSPALAGALVQHSRQRADDTYDVGSALGHLRERLGERPILTDDNYAVLKVAGIGCELGADLATFSGFKVRGPEGVGVVLGRRAPIERVRDENRSGGSLVQGREAMELLRGMVVVPVLAAIQAETTREIERRLNAGEVRGVRRAAATNMEETIVLVELERPVARAAIERAVELGAAPHPVGAESRYEIAPMFYRPSKAMLSERPELADTVIRINPYRAGADHVVRLLAEALHHVEG